MNILFDSGNFIFTAPFIVQLFSIIFLFIRKERPAFLFWNVTLLAGITAGILVTLSTSHFLSFLPGLTEVNLNNWIKLDGLSCFFLFIIQLIAIPTTLYNFSYLQHHIDQKRPIKNFSSFYTVILIFLQLTVIANQAIFFLVSWEIMSVSAYFGMVLEREKEEVQRGSFYYFVSSHVVVFILYLVFFLLHHQSGSWFFNDYHLYFDSDFVAPVIFILSFIGFGIKAGFMPFHFWLPQAHPVAPTVLSAFLSGVIIKSGIYGILRTFTFIRPVPEWCGWIALVISIITAIFGVWYALAQHDIKKLLAYHSVENIGIIGIGIGIGFIGSANNLPAVEILGFGGALLHTLNHAIFKSLLFIGSGVLYQNLGTRNIELMGGLVHRSRYLALFFLIGSVAISGIPPFNGFISEFIIYTGFFRAANELKDYYPILILMLVVGLAFVGGLAVACFTKVNSIIFLGCERKEVKQFHTSVFDVIPLGFLAGLCIIIGFYPQPFIAIVNNVIRDGMIAANFDSALTEIDWLYITIVFCAIAGGIVLVFLVKIMHAKKYGRRISPAWGCGYEDITPRMQYTASSFADELNTIPKTALLYHKKVDVLRKPFPVLSKFESHSKDFVDEKLVLPAYNFIKKLVSKIEVFSQTDIRYYIAFILIIITIYSIMAFLWV